MLIAMTGLQTNLLAWSIVIAICAIGGLALFEIQLRLWRRTAPVERPDPANRRATFAWSAAHTPLVKPIRLVVGIAIVGALVLALLALLI